MNVRVAAMLLISAAVVAGATRPARADGPGIVVHVHDAGDAGPVRNALVRLVGASAQHTYVGRTDNSGETSFAGSRCESGLLLVEAAGYNALRRRVSCDAVAVVIDVSLTPVLATIGRTHNASSPLAKVTVSMGPDSAVRRANPTLVEALDQLSGVSARDQGVGFNAGIRGQDPSTTEYSLNGVPLGAAAASLAINSDLLSSASVDEANDAVALFSASPSALPQYSSELRFGNYEDTFQRYQASGTVHGDGLGYVFVHTSRGLASALNDLTYTDESGLDYEHHGVRHTTGNLIRLTDAVGATSVSFTSSVSAMSAELIPTYYSGMLPAGAGPGTHQDTIASNPVLFVSAPLRGGQLSLSAAQWRLSTWNDASSRLVALTPDPETGFDRIGGTDVTLSFSAVPSQNRNVNVSLSRTASSSNGVTRAAIAATSFGGAFASSTHGSVARIAEDWHADARVPFGVSLKDESSDGLGGALELGWSAQYVLSPRARVRYSGLTGTKLVDLGTSQASPVLSDPASAEFDCRSRAAFLAGPGATRTRSRAASHDLSASVSGARANLTLSLYQHAYTNASIGSIPFVAASLPAGYFPPGFLAALVEQYRSAGGCIDDLAIDRIFVQQTFAGVDVVYRGATANAHLALSRAWNADFNVGLERARVVGGDPRLRATPFFAGSFVPGVPGYKGNVTLSWQPNERTAALLSTTLAGPHNARELPSYAVVNAALEHRASPSSTLALLVTNVFDTLTDPFVSGKFAVPLRDAYGRVVPTYASPLLPRRIELRYSLHFGRDGSLR